jgi:hypothetical protein
MGWHKWYEDTDSDPGLFSSTGCLGLLFLPFILVFELIFGFILVIAPPIFFGGRWLAQAFGKKYQPVKSVISGNDEAGLDDTI